MEAELQKKIDGLNHQIDLLSDKRNTIIKLNRTAKTAIDVFRDIQEKDKLERNNLELLSTGSWFLRIIWKSSYRQTLIRSCAAPVWRKP